MNNDSAGNNSNPGPAKPPAGRHPPGLRRSAARRAAGRGAGTPVCFVCAACCLSLVAIAAYGCLLYFWLFLFVGGARARLRQPAEVRGETLQALRLRRGYPTSYHRIL